MFLSPLFLWVCVFALINIEQHLEAILFCASTCDPTAFQLHYQRNNNFATTNRIIHRWQCCSNEHDKWLNCADWWILQIYFVDTWNATHVSICGAMAVIEWSQQTWDWFGLSFHCPISSPIVYRRAHSVWRRWRKKTHWQTALTHVSCPIVNSRQNDGARQKTNWACSKFSLFESQNTKKKYNSQIEIVEKYV